MARLILVNEDDLLDVLDYAQPDEEKDIEHEPENDTPNHVVYVMRRLRTQASESESPWSTEEEEME